MSPFPFLIDTITEIHSVSNGSGKQTSCFAIFVLGPKKVCIFIFPISILDELVVIRLFIQIQPHSKLSANTKLCDLPYKFRSGRILLYANNEYNTHVRIQIRNDEVLLLDAPNDLHYDCFVVGLCNDI